ncbi:MAG TPA: hypothetical protein DC042_00440 [Bacteroidales bacterium]|nr:MAG: hypothetical protein A2017_00040 [Lentisphaerae bacterium GWF2_44_16]HBB90221.1 hypothetical protein [Bacteroidales bacterium]
MNYPSTKKPVNWAKWIVIGLLAFFGIGYMMCGRGGDPGSESKHLTLTAEEQKPIENLIEAGSLIIKYKDAYVPPLVWYNSDAQGKENFAAKLAIYATNKVGDDLYYCNIYDGMSGKKIAKWSKSWGYKVY